MGEAHGESAARRLSCAASCGHVSCDVAVQMVASRSGFGGVQVAGERADVEETVCHGVCRRILGAYWGRRMTVTRVHGCDALRCVATSAERGRKARPKLKHGSGKSGEQVALRQVCCIFEDTQSIPLRC